MRAGVIYRDGVNAMASIEVGSCPECSELVQFVANAEGERPPIKMVEVCDADGKMLPSEVWPTPHRCRDPRLERRS